jgi:hypothetical protein
MTHLLGWMISNWPIQSALFICLYVIVKRIIAENKEQQARDAYIDRLYASRVASGELGHISPIHTERHWQ